MRTSSSNTNLASVYRYCPASVGRRVLCERSNSCTPVALSRRETAWLIAGCVRFITCAAWRVDPVMTTV
ncbi:hypothetical protein D3C78_1960250 [compost metagenome]